MSSLSGEAAKQLWRQNVKRQILTSPDECTNVATYGSVWQIFELYGWWVPQGSVLGLSAVHGGLESHDLGPHTWAYADSTRIYGSCRPTAAARLQMPMSACIDEVALWMRSNRLQVNTGKRRRCHCEPWVDSSTHQHGSATTTCRATCESPL